MKDFLEEIFIAIDDLHKNSNFTIFIMENLVESNSDNNQNFHLRNTVFWNIKPTNPTQYILHILLAMGILVWESVLGMLN